MSDSTDLPAIKLIDSARHMFLGKEDQFAITHASVEEWPQWATVVVDVETLTKAARMVTGYESAGLALRTGAAIVPLQAHESFPQDLLAGEFRRHVAVVFPYNIREWKFMAGVLAAYSCGHTHAWNWRMLVGLATAYSSGTTVFHDVLDLLPAKLPERRHFSICPGCLARFRVELSLYIEKLSRDREALASAREELLGEFPGRRGLHIIMRGGLQDPFASVFAGQGDLPALDGILALIASMARPEGLAIFDITAVMRRMAQLAEQERQQQSPAPPDKRREDVGE